MKKNLQSVISFHKYHTLLISILFLVLIVIFSSYLYDQDSKYVKYDREVRQRHFQEYKKLVDLKFHIAQNELRHLRYACEADLFETSKNEKFEMPFAYSLMNNGPKGFDLDGIEKFKDKIGINITGNGLLTGRTKDFYRFLRMALLLNDDFIAIKKNIPELKFIYHYSIKEIYMQYPWEPSNVFRFDKDLYGYDNWKLALPKANPDKKNFWTEIYYDYGGKGLMTTCVTPIYDNEKFVGIIAIDLTVDFLNTIIRNFEPEKDGFMIITDQKDNLIAHPNISSFDKKIKKLTDGIPKSLLKYVDDLKKIKDKKWAKIQDWWVIHSKMDSAPFHVYYFEPCESKVLALIKRMTISNFLLISCMVIIVFTSIILTQRKIIRPSLAFVNFILAKSRGEEVYPGKRLPRIWRPWFTTINDVFNENNMLTENIKQNNIVLVRRNIELQKEIGAKEKAEKEKEALEKQLIEEEKLKAIGLLVGGIAHDFNNQLAIIMGYTSILRSQAHLSEDKKQQCLDQMLSAADSSSGLIKQLLAFAQKGKYQNIPIDIHEIINDMVSILNHTIDKRITIKVDFSATLYTVQGDRAQIQNAIMNIAINAKNAMPNGGMITFKTINEILTKEQCKHSEFNLQPGKFIKISIIDTGIGITAENKKHIFEPFFTTKNSSHGTGLGLAAALGAIKNHKGYITVEDTFGVGSNFSILLPVMGKNVIGKSTKTRKINVSKSKSKLLLIDDEAEFCRMLTDFMGALGYTVITYTDPLKAIEYYRNSWKELDLVIMDMIMPKISGLDMINEFQRINSLARIIISSGYSAEKDVHKLLEDHEHILGFYRKPFDLIQFANDISSFLK